MTPPTAAATPQGYPARTTPAATALPAPAWIEASLRLPVADAELVCDALGVLAPGGVALEPPFRNVDPDRFGLELVEGEELVRAYFAAPLTRAERRAIRRRLAALPLAGALPRLRYAAVADEGGWADAWKQHFRPLWIGGRGEGVRLLVRPSWDETTDVPPGTVVVTLDPGRAFGTGQHATTRLCLEAIARLVRPGDVVVDVGTGSGILAIAAARLGATMVHALDTDPEALVATRENIARNAAWDGYGDPVADRIEVRAGSLGAAWPLAAGWPAPAQGVYDLVVANISSAVVLELLPAAAAALAGGGHLVASGFFREAAPRIEAAARAAGLLEIAIEHELAAADEPVASDGAAPNDAAGAFDGEWSALIARAPRTDAP